MAYTFIPYPWWKSLFLTFLCKSQNLVLKMAWFEVCVPQFVSQFCTQPVSLDSRFRWPCLRLDALREFCRWSLRGVWHVWGMQSVLSRWKQSRNQSLLVFTSLPSDFKSSVSGLPSPSLFSLVCLLLRCWEWSPGPPAHWASSVPGLHPSFQGTVSTSWLLLTVCSKNSSGDCRIFLHVTKSGL